MNIIKSAKISRFLLKSVRDFNEFHTPRASGSGIATMHQWSLSDELKWEMKYVSFVQICQVQLCLLNITSAIAIHSICTMTV